MEKRPIVHGTSHGYNRHGCRCDDCRAAATALKRAQRARQPDYRQRAATAMRERRGEMKAKLDAYKIEQGCIDCGYREHAVALHFDHRGELPKRANVSYMIACSPEVIWAEVAKCDVRCANCHAVMTEQRGYWNQR